jgi:hypothetical protein
MDDYFELQLAQKNKVFNDLRSGFERRDSDRRKVDLAKQIFQERRVQELEVENERRKAHRRLTERRTLEERRVTSNYSQERLEEERHKLNRKSSVMWFQFLTVTFFALAGLLIYSLWKLTGIE